MFAYSSTREQSNKRSVKRMKTESETAERRHGRVRLARFARVKSVCLRIQVRASMSSKRSVTRMKTESETAERCHGRVRLARFARVRLLRHALPISLLILRKKNNCFAVFTLAGYVYTDAYSFPS